MRGERKAEDSEREGVGERARERMRGSVNLDCMQRLMFTKLERERERTENKARERQGAT